MFGLTKLTTVLTEHLKILTQEKIKQTELMKSQNTHLKELVLQTKRANDFNRLVYTSESGMEVPENDKDYKKMQDFQLDQSNSRNAFSDVYFADISLGNKEAEEG